MVDTHGGTGGMIRGFLNDGSVDYSTRATLDSLVFGQCQYAYRNLGRPSQVKLRQQGANFRVEVDGRLCFESEKVQMPQGYKFGLTAATPDNPDSFEIFKMVVMADKSGSESSRDNNNQQQQQQKEYYEKGKPRQQPQKDKKDGEPSQFFQRDDNAANAEDPYEVPDEDADTITSSASQFADLHDRLQLLNHHVSSMQKMLTKASRTSDKRHDELTKAISALSADVKAIGTVDTLVKRMEGMEKELRGLKNEVGSKVRASEKNLKSVLTDHHATLADNIPGHSKLIMVIVASQFVLVGLYVVYKRKQNAMPKKYV